MSGINDNIKPPIKNKKAKPSQIPKKWGTDAFLPNFIPDAINIELLGPGVIAVTNAKIKNSNIMQV